MLIRLALETTVHHGAADEHRLRGLNVTTLDDYRMFLARIFGFESVVERAVLRLQTREHVWLESRMRTPLLREDLRVLGIGEDELARVPLSTAIHISSVADGLGWLFVLERLTLLAGQLRRHVEGALGSAVAGATRYLAARGDRPGAAFRAFGDWLGELAETHSPSVIVRGASEAFRAQHHWYEQKWNISFSPARARMDGAASDEPDAHAPGCIAVTHVLAR